METSFSLATESFSYSWLSNSKPSSDSLLPEPPLGLSVHSSYENFNFDVSNLQSSPSLIAHADELFSDGLIKPVLVDPFKGQSSNNTADSIETTMPSCSVSLRTVSARPVRVISHGFLRKQRSTRQRLKDFFRLLRRFFGEFGWSKKSTRVGHIDKAEWEATPKPTGVYCDNENSIYEAVLHCKRTIETYSPQEEYKRIVEEESEEASQ